MKATVTVTDSKAVSTKESLKETSKDTSSSTTTETSKEEQPPIKQDNGKDVEMETD